MTFLGLIAFVFGVLGVWLTIKQSIWCWPVSIVAVISSIIEFYEQRLFGDMALQIFYFFAAVYGWIYWEQQAKKSFAVTRMASKHWLPVLIFTLLQWALYYFLLSRFKGDQVLFDSLLTACSLTATYMMTRKWLENWTAWVIIDGAYIFLYLIKEIWLFALLYLFFAVIAYIGWIKWRKA